jgi:hypothetical protein
MEDPPTLELSFVEIFKGKVFDLLADQKATKDEYVKLIARAFGAEWVGG